MEKLEKNATYLSLSKKVLTPADLEEIGSHTKLSVVWLEQCRIKDGDQSRKLGDEDLAALARLVKLEDLVISNSEITDEGLSVLAGFPKLKFLSLERSAMTGSGFAALSGLSKLETLWLNNTMLDDENLKYLKALPRLSTLLIAGTAVTHEGLWSLASMKHLSVPEGGIFTEEDILEFRKRQIAQAAGAPPASPEMAENVNAAVSQFMERITVIEKALQELELANAGDDLKKQQYQAFNDLFDELCDLPAGRRYTRYGCHFQYFTYEFYSPVTVVATGKAKALAYYLDVQMQPVRFLVVLKDGVWKLLGRQSGIRQKWVNVGL